MFGNTDGALLNSLIAWMDPYAFYTAIKVGDF